MFKLQKKHLDCKHALSTGLSSRSFDIPQIHPNSTFKNSLGWQLFAGIQDDLRC